MHFAPAAALISPGGRFFAPAASFLELRAEAAGILRPMTVVVVKRLQAPVVVIHGGAGAYLRTTTPEQRARRGAALAQTVQVAHRAFGGRGARGAVLAAMEQLERDETFNAGYGSRLQRDGVARLSASLMHGNTQRLSAVYNVQDCLHPSQLADALQARPDRNLDGSGAAELMREISMPQRNVRSARSIERWQRLVETGAVADREAAIGSADADAADQAETARLPIPDDLNKGALAEGDTLPDENDRYGTVGAVALDADRQLWACTSTGGRGHEPVGRVSDSPTPAGNYACPRVALSATGFGEQILDLNLCGRIATRMLDGAVLESALRRTFDEVAAFGGLLGVIAVADDGTAGYAHSTEACGVAWFDAAGDLHIDQHGSG